MFVELYGSREVGLGAGIAGLELRRASVETAGCRERFDHREWIATGSEPAWRLEVTSRDLVIGLLGGPPTQRVPHGGPRGRMARSSTRRPRTRAYDPDRRAALHRSAIRLVVRLLRPDQERGAHHGRLRGAQSRHAGTLRRGRGGDMDDIERLKEAIGSARRIVAFTGAGISTEIRHSRLPLAGRHLDEIQADLLRRLHGVGDAPRVLAASSPPTRPFSRPSPMPAIARWPSWSSRDA